MKIIAGVLACLLTVIGLAQEPINVKVSGQIFNTTAKEVKLVQEISQTERKEFVVSKFDKDGNFSIATTLPHSDYYILSIPEGAIHLILTKDSDIKVYCDAKSIGQFTNMVGSPESNEMHKFIYDAMEWNALKNDANVRMQANPAQSDEINRELRSAMKILEGKFQVFYNNVQGTPAVIAALHVIDANQDFASFEGIVLSLKQMFGQSTTVKNLVAYYEQMKAKKEAENMFAPGKPAPDFEEVMLDRTSTMKLSDLRGKVVLLDFWASWCGPCRKENPNVVRVYNAYKDKGFTVMNVSLDDNLDRWKQAIEADGLVWPNHVSDLKKWNSKVGALYNVRSIPFTVLIDQNGNIVATNLRGEALEQAVANLLK